MYKSEPLTRTQIFAAVPGLAVTEALFATSQNQLFCIKNRRREYVSVNDAFVARSRMPSRAAVVGKTAGQLFPPLLAAGYEQQDGAVLSGAKAITDKLELITNADGTTGWYVTQKEPVRDATGRVIAIAAVSTDLHRLAAGDPRLGAVAGAIERIHTEYDQPLRMADLAKDAGMSQSQFERRVRQVLRLSPRRLLTQTRIEAAARLLRQSAEPLQTVAVRCGFYDQAQFCRQFRFVTGLTPGQYRASIE